LSSDLREDQKHEEDPMANTTIGHITIVYRGETRQFTTVSLALHFLRQEHIKMGWFHKMKADVELIVDDKVSQTRHLKGDKLLIMKELEHLQVELQQANT
jgi:hypothetical protein